MATNTTSYAATAAVRIIRVTFLEMKYAKITVNHAFVNCITSRVYSMASPCNGMIIFILFSTGWKISESLHFMWFEDCPCLHRVSKQCYRFQQQSCKKLTMTWAGLASLFWQVINQILIHAHNHFFCWKKYSRNVIKVLIAITHVRLKKAFTRFFFFKNERGSSDLYLALSFVESLLC